MPERRRIYVPDPDGVGETARQEFQAALERLDGAVAIHTPRLPDEGRRATVAERLLTRLRSGLMQGKPGALAELRYAVRQYWRDLTREAKREAKYDWRDTAELDRLEHSDGLARAEELILVREALGYLTEDERWVARRLYWDCWTWDEIGRALGRSGDAARVAFRRALDRASAEAEARRNEGTGRTRQDGEQTRGQPPGRTPPRGPARGPAQV